MIDRLACEPRGGACEAPGYDGRWNQEAVFSARGYVFSDFNRRLRRTPPLGSRVDW